MPPPNNNENDIISRADKVDCAELLEKLGFHKEGGRWFRPAGMRRPGDQSGIVVRPATTERLSSWEDWDRTDDSGNFLAGGPIELLQYLWQMDRPEAIAQVYAVMGWLDEQEEPEASQVDLVARRALERAHEPQHRDPLLAWTAEQGLPDTVVLQAIEAGSVGVDTYRNPRLAAGQAWHGGDSMAAIVRDPSSRAPVAVELHYFDPEANGGHKQRTLGDRNAGLWCIDWRRMPTARRVVITLSVLDALAVESLRMPNTVAVALRSTWSARAADWRLLRGKAAAIAIAPGKVPEDGPSKGYAPGSRAVWEVHAALLALDIPVLAVDTQDWHDDGEPLQGPADVLRAWGAAKLAAALKKMEPWLVTGMPGGHKPGDVPTGKPRLWLPRHDFLSYWRYRVRDDFTQFVARYSEKPKDEDEEAGKAEKVEGEELSITYESVAGFRVAGISRVRIASPLSTMTGDPDLAPNTVFSISVQVPRYGDRLLRRVVADEDLHNVEKWKKLGPIYSAPNFLRMVNILERAADIGARDAINFVGLAWRDGRTVVNEGPDCYFADPVQQCPYYNLSFPSGAQANAKRVMQAFQRTFRANGASKILVWALGAHLKAFLGFWPHFAFGADKGVGKDTLLGRLQRAVGMSVYSRQSMQTEFRILTSISYTSHPVGWGELSANKKDLIDKAVHNLQECYQYTHTRRGAELKDFLLCAPVLLAGEDLEELRSLHGKLVRNKLTKQMQGDLMPDDLPVFPVREWLNYLAELSKDRVRQLHADAREALAKACSATASDAGAARMLTNYGALRAAWVLLCDFAGLPVEEGGFLQDLTAEMNAHILESNGDRQPWVWIVDTLLSEISRNTFRFPYAWTTHEDAEVLAVRTSHVMDHISREQSLREFYNGLPIKSDRVLKQQLIQADVVLSDAIERTVAGRRISNMCALSLEALGRYGLHATPTVAEEEPPPEFGMQKPPTAGQKQYQRQTQGY